MQSSHTKSRQEHRTAYIKIMIKQIVANRSIWVRSCGYIVSKKGAELSGYTSSAKGHHVHCPKCGKVLAQFIDPK